jgi:hypothetical protein
MSSERRVGRREFMMASAAGVAAGVMPACQAATVQDLEAAVAMVGRLPRRKLGRGDRKVSVLVGAATWSREAVEAGIRCGVNFWHAAHEWDRGNVPPAILKDRKVALGLWLPHFSRLPPMQFCLEVPQVRGAGLAPHAHCSQRSSRWYERYKNLDFTYLNWDSGRGGHLKRPVCASMIGIGSSASASDCPMVDLNLNREF